VYRDVDASDPQGIQHFLEQHTSDGQKFGGLCKSTAWIGLSLCKRAAELTGDRKLLGETAPFEDEHAAMRMLSELGRLVSSTGNGALVLLVDQLEDIYHLDEAATRFRLAMDALRHLADHVPTAVIVVACLEDFYIELRRFLAGPCSTGWSAIRTRCSSRRAVASQRSRS
jgi:hypothetical protein